MKYSIIFMIIAVACFFYNVEAQTELSEDINEEVLLNELTTQQQNLLNLNFDTHNRNASYLEQEGVGNKNVVIQIAPSPTAEGNNAIVLQYGNGNNSNINQFGSDNTSRLIQSGNDNQYDLSVSGFNISTLVYQKGDNHSVIQDLKGDGLNYVIKQDGFNNEVIQEEDRSKTTLPGYQLHQQGSNMKIEIRQGNIY